MTFTDDDLKRLKELLNRKETNYNAPFSADRQLALLARLEAAEYLIDRPDRGPEYVKDLEIWRKAAGK